MIDEEVNDVATAPSKEEKETPDAAPEEEPRKEKQEKPVVQVIGYVDSTRKIQTKKGDNMLIVMCSSTGWKFTVVVFPKFYDQIAHLIKPGEIILVKGRLNCKVEMREISIEGEQVKRSTISDLRTAAKNDGIFGDEEEPNNNSHACIFPDLQEKYECEINGNKMTIKLGANTEKSTLLDIKNQLESYPV